jgi:exoribonuclease R
MTASDRRTREVERAVVDATEAWLLHGSVGRTFRGVVVEAGEDTGTVVLDVLAVRARCSGRGLEPGARVEVRLTEADVVARRVRFEVVT